MVTLEGDDGHSPWSVRFATMKMNEGPPCPRRKILPMIRVEALLTIFAKKVVPAAPSDALTLESGKATTMRRPELRVAVRRTRFCWLKPGRARIWHCDVSCSIYCSAAITYGLPGGAFELRGSAIPQQTSPRRS